MWKCEEHPKSGIIFLNVKRGRWWKWLGVDPFSICHGHRDGGTNFPVWRVANLPAMVTHF
jgi:hypothetical protein